MSNSKENTCSKTARREKKARIAALADGDKDYDTPCGNCDAVPTVTLLRFAVLAASVKLILLEVTGEPLRA